MASKKKKPQGKIIRLPRVRLSFPDVFEPRAVMKGGEPRFGANFLLDPKNPKHKAALLEIKAETTRLIDEYWDGNPPPGTKNKPFAKDEFWGKGETQTAADTGEIYNGYAGMYYIRANSKADRPPYLSVKEQGEKREANKNDPAIYGGVFCNATINLYIQDNDAGQGIRCALRGIQSLNYGDSFSQNQVTEKEFEDFDDDEEDDDLDDDGL